MKEGDTIGFKRKALLASTVFTFITLTVTGTLAWYQISSQAIIEITGRNSDDYMVVGGTLHNDHEENYDNHDIYVENWGTRSLYTRIRLSEYMAFGDENALIPIIPNMDAKNPDTWKIHIPSSADTPEICGDTNNPSSDFHTYWSWIMGGQKYYYPAPDDKRVMTDNGASYVDTNNIALNANSPDSDYGKPVCQTLNAEVLTMQQWLAAGRPIGNYWVIDTDGWAYWADGIKPGTATGLLLDSAKFISKINGAYDYKISVKAQMATKANETGTYYDYTRFGESGWTENGRALMELITSNDTDIMPSLDTDQLTSSLPVFDGKIYVRPGSGVKLGLKDVSGGTDINIIPEHINNALLTWDPENSVWDISVEKTAKPFSNFICSLQADNAGSSATVMIVALPEDAKGVITARGGKPVLDYGNGSYRPINEDDKGQPYGDCWINGSDLQNNGFAIVSTLPIVNEVVYIKQGESGSLTGTGTSPGFQRIMGNFPVDNEYYSVYGSLNLLTCKVTAKPNAPPGTRFVVKISQYSSESGRLGKQQEVVFVIIPSDAEGIVTNKNGKVYVTYSGGFYRELTGGVLGPKLTKEAYELIKYT